MKAQQAQQSAAQAAQTAQASATQSENYATDPYAQVLQNSIWNMTPPMGTGLEFQDVYKSPYAGLI